MKLVFIHGMPGVGKLTVARELGRQTGFPVFHNHLVVDMLTPVFEFGGQAFVEMRETVWIEVMTRAAKERLPGLIFTFAPERTVRPQFIGQLVEDVEDLGGHVCFVDLICPEQVMEGRLGNEDRLKFDKLSSAKRYRELRDMGTFVFPPLPDSGLHIDTSKLSPDDSAQRIIQHFGLPKRTA